jgi:hypothetical protein
VSFRSAIGRITGLVFLAVLMWFAAFITGCGNNEANTPAVVPPSETTHTPKVAASGPAVSEPVEFNQLALESPVKKFTKQGIVYLRFRYADRDGNVYECELPEEMSKGSYTIDEWTRTFNVFRLPKVVAKKKIAPKKDKQTELRDFPFISPKPQKTQQQPPVKQQPSVEPMPIPMPKSDQPIQPVPSTPQSPSARD